MYLSLLADYGERGRELKSGSDKIELDRSDQKQIDSDMQWLL